MCARGGLRRCGRGRQRQDSPSEKTPITVWIADTEPERVQAARQIFAGFTRSSGIKVSLDALGDDGLAPRVARAARDGTLPDVIQLPMASAHAYARQRILNADAAQDVVRDLGEDTFSARALSVLTSEGRVTAIPSDGWGQLLIYGGPAASRRSSARSRPGHHGGRPCQRGVPVRRVHTLHGLHGLAGDLAAGQVPAVASGRPVTRSAT